MEHLLIPPAEISVLGIPGIFLSLLIPVVGICAFLYIIARRLIPLAKGTSDPRFDRFPTRIKKVLLYWLAQYKQPRYRLAGVLHILIFAGFIILSIRSISLVIMGVNPEFVFPGLDGTSGVVYSVLKDYAATVVLLACIAAGIRRGVFKPERYKVPAKYGTEHTWEAIFVLGLIGGLMVFESLFEATAVAAQAQQGAAVEMVAPLSLAWFFSIVLGAAPIAALQSMHSAAYFLHDLIFFFFLCFLPFGKHFHVISSIFNVVFLKLDRGRVKPVRWDVSDEELDNLESFGVRHLEDFTWKHMLDFYTCVDCGRCSDNCPAATVGRPLSPRFISIKARDHCFDRFPVFGEIKEREPLVGNVFEEDEIWSCTTCGACEEECPVMNEYIDKMVDLRRAMVEEGKVPQSLQKPLGALEKRGNPYGKMEKKRQEWTQELPEGVQVQVAGSKENPETLFFVDSASSFDERLQEIARASATILHYCGEDFGILGKAERDSGHEVRRFGEEMLFQTLRDTNTQAIQNSGAKRLLTSDPHAFNALNKDYADIPPAQHISQFILDKIRSGAIKLKPLQEDVSLVTYHDPCYMGRHNLLYDTPRQILDSIPGLTRVEMERSRDRSFCCGGGGLMLFYEPPEEEQRMGQKRAQMIAETGADLVVSCCPFCLTNLEDGIKTSGKEGQIQIMDLTELVVRHLDWENK
ncbi:MAG: (Fe-S)-binding protein [Desulfohalobiaceae bacterium]|nr:(Fe-S)-binding protein [Desulfohalobiaceae bacterium]